MNTETMDLADSLSMTDAGCLSLLVAVMQNAIEEVRGEAVIGGNDVPAYRKALQKKARRYILSENIAPFSFLWICEQLNIDTHFIRDAVIDGSIKEWQKQKVGRGTQHWIQGLPADSQLFTLRPRWI